MDSIVEFIKNVVFHPSPRSFYLLSAAAIVLYRIPVVDRILRTFHTLLHESGHAFAALLTGGKNHRMELNPNMSGLTITESKSKFHQFIISISGYPFASAFAFGGIFLITHDITGVFMITLLVLTAFQLLMNIRNLYGIIWSLAVIALMFLLLLKMPQLMWATGVVVNSVVLFESFVMAGHILLLSFKKPKMAGDAANLHALTGIHALIWGVFFFAQAAFFVFISVSQIIIWDGYL